MAINSFHWEKNPCTQRMLRGTHEVIHKRHTHENKSGYLRD